MRTFPRRIKGTSHNFSSIPHCFWMTEFSKKGMESWSFLEHSEENSLRTQGEGRSRGDLWEFGRQCGHFLLRVISWWSGGERGGSPLGWGLIRFYHSHERCQLSRGLAGAVRPGAGYQQRLREEGGLHPGTEQEAETLERERAEVRITVLFFKKKKKKFCCWSIVDL